MEVHKRSKLPVILLITVLLGILLGFFVYQKNKASPHGADPVSLGRRCLTELSFEQALLYFTQAIEIDPNNTAAYLGRAQAYVGVGDSYGAQSDVITLTELYQEAPAAIVQVIVDSRTEELTKAPDYVEALLDRGSAFVAQGNTESAQTDFDAIAVVDEAWRDVLAGVLHPELRLEGGDGASSQAASSAAASESGAANTEWSWAVEPSIEAQDINVLRARFALYNEDYSEDYSTKGRMINGPYCTITGDGSTYGLIGYDGSLAAPMSYGEITYDDSTPYVLDGGEYALMSEDGQLTPSTKDDVAQMLVGASGFLTWSQAQATLYESDAYAPFCYEMSPVYSEFTAAYCVSTLDDSLEYDTSSAVMGWVLVNNGSPINGEIYEDAGAVSNGLVAVKKGGLWGYVDASGREIVPCVCDATLPYYGVGYAYDASEGYITVSINGQYAMYDTNGSIVIEPGTFEELRPVYNGKCWAKQNGLWGVLSISGEGALAAG